jgi:NO-binding membrane sensor protein with MHYT domain
MLLIGMMLPANISHDAGLEVAAIVVAFVLAVPALIAFFYTTSNYARIASAFVVACASFASHHVRTPINHS